MSGPLHVRLATEADLPAARRLVQDAGLPLDGFGEAAVVLVALRSGHLLGVAALEDRADEHGRAFLLRSVAVRANARGHGIGTALTHAALRHVDRSGAPVALLTETAPDWFPRFAFAAVDRAALPSALEQSEELRGACAESAVPLLREPQPPTG